MIDIVLQSIKTAENYTKRIEKEGYFQAQQTHKKATKLLIDSRRTYQQQVEAIAAANRQNYLEKYSAR